MTGLFIVIDAFGNLEEFIAHGENQEGGLIRVLAEYYGARTLTFFDRTSALLALVAAMFVVSWLQKTNEFTALMAARRFPALASSDRSSLPFCLLASPRLRIASC